MRPVLDRRAFFTATAAGLLLPVRPALAGLWADSGFTHGVASGDPGPDSIKVWTRYAAPGGGDATLKVEVASDTGFRRIIARADTVAGPATWGTAQARISGLPQKGWVYYRFTAPDGTKSPVGRTRALPAGKLSQFKIAVFSCANKPFGWFNAYAHAAARDDIDLVVHLGDYLYEYPRGAYPSLAETVAGRDIEGAGEMLDLDSYRQRYASYRVDPALQELHRRFPMIAIWDDHEFANDAWRGGAQNHGADEGDWFKRKAIARQVHGEWLPGPDRIWQRYDIGDLISVVTLDTRLEGREEQLDMGAAMKDGVAGLKTFRDTIWSDPSRSLLGPEQETFLADTLKASVASGQKWQLVAQQIVMGTVVSPKESPTWLPPNPSKRSLAYVQGGVVAASVGLPGNMDSWGGYPAARSRLLKAAQAADADMVVISGDSHNAWAFNLAEGGKAAGVEFAGQSVTSPGFESALVADPAIIRAAVVANSPEMTWCDTSRRGYLTVDFTTSAARCDWVFMSTIKSAVTTTGKGQSARVTRGKRAMELV